MALDPITAGMSLVSGVIDRIFPDKTEALKAKSAMAELQVQGQLQEQTNEFNLQVEQIKTDAVEAASSSIFVAGWRPFVGWMCGVALGYNYIFFPLYAYTAQLFYKAAPPMPKLDVGELIPLLMSLLGMGIMRSYDKAQQLASPCAVNPAPVKPGA
jgi:hypothetical protein